jgi:hypothetical protein
MIKLQGDKILSIYERGKVRVKSYSYPSLNLSHKGREVL